MRSITRLDRNRSPGCCASIAGLPVLLLAAAISTSTPLAAQSSMYRGGPAHPGTSRETPVEHFGGVAWRFQTDGMVRASPTVRDGTIYIGSTDGEVYALAVVDGAVRWHANAGAPVSATIATTRTLAIVQADDGTVLALSLRDGARRWIRHGGPPLPLAWGHENGDYFTSSPLVLTEENVIVAGRDGLLVSLDAGTGKERWHYAAGAQLWSSPASADGIVVVGDQRGRVHAVAASTGAPKWRFRTLADSLRSGNFGFDRQTIQSSPAISESTVLIGARDGLLYALDLVTGKERWRYDHDVSWVNPSPAVLDGMVYVASSDAAFADAVDLKTGKEQWRATRLGLSWSSPLATEKLVYVTTAGGRVHALDRATGARRWDYRADGSIWSSPVLAGGLLLFGSDDGGVYAIRNAPADLQRAVYWDSTMADINSFGGHEELRDYLAGRGWPVLGTDSLAAFLRARVVDRSPSVVIFAQDQLPPELAGVAADTVLLRRYLDAGGKVVWAGIPPLLWPRDTAGPEIGRIDRAACGPILGVDCGPANFNDWRVTPTETGRRWGLSGWWIAGWSVTASSVTEVLGYDQRGDASAFVKSFGGPPGTGFIRVGGGDTNPFFRGRRRVDPEMIRRVAEYFPLAGSAH